LILQTSALAFLIVKTLGAAYLIYLGIKAWREKSTFHLPTSTLNVSSRRVFWQGVLSNVLNPKVAIFFLAFLPQFVEKGGPHVALQMVMLGLTFAFFGLCFLLMVGYSSGKIGSLLTRRPHFGQFLGRLAGGVMIGLGIRLALTERG
jgi:threonine/homoserine/homoserine lactone efflux protein